MKLKNRERKKNIHIVRCGAVFLRGKRDDDVEREKSFGLAVKEDMYGAKSEKEIAAHIDGERKK